MAHIDALCRVLDPSGLDVVDVGAGAGAFVAALARKGARPIGIEIAADKVAEARQQSGADIRLGTAQALPVDDASCDLVTYIFSFHHIPRNHHDTALAEAARVLRRGGHIFVAEPEIEGDMSRIVAAIDDETEVRTAALASLSDLPLRHGFVRRECAGYTLTRHYPSFDALLATLVAVDPDRQAKAADPATRARMQQEFDNRSKAGPGGFAVDQPVRCMIFDRAD